MYETACLAKKFALPESERVRIEIYNAMGQKILLMWCLNILHI